MTLLLDKIVRLHGVFRVILAPHETWPNSGQKKKEIETEERIIYLHKMTTCLFSSSINYIRNIIEKMQLVNNEAQFYSKKK